MADMIFNLIYCNKRGRDSTRILGRDNIRPSCSTTSTEPALDFPIQKNLNYLLFFYFTLIHWLLHVLQKIFRNKKLHASNMLSGKKLLHGHLILYFDGNIILKLEDTELKRTWVEGLIEWQLRFEGFYNFNAKRHSVQD